MLAAWPEQDPTPRLKDGACASSNPVAYGDLAESGSGSEHLTRSHAHESFGRRLPDGRLPSQRLSSNHPKRS
jgi:hypothetical protein